MDTVVAPNPASTVITDSERNYHRHTGLEGKDAAFINELATLNAIHATDKSVAASDRFAALGMSDIRTELAKSFGCGALETEKTASRVQKDVADKTFAVYELVRAEAAKTREMLLDMQKDATREKLADAKNENFILKLKIGGINLPV